MSGSGKSLVWLTALTTASLVVTGCNGAGSRPPAADPAADPVTSQAPSPSHSPSPTPPRPFVLVVSDGSDVVRVAGRSVRFPVLVTDATVSPNGMVVAFVDGAGNIATARLDGTGLRVLTSTDPEVRRAHPTFEDGGSEIVFSERGHDGGWRLKEVAADGHDDLTAGKPDPTVAETEEDGGHDTAPSATWFQASHTDTARSVMAFEHRTRTGKIMVYVADRNQRGFGATPLLPGRSPAVSPTGDRVAFIGSHGQIEVQAVPLLTRRPHPAQITWGAHPSGHLAWSPDGHRIFFSTPRDVESVRSTPAQPGRNPVRVVLRHPGVASAGTVARSVVGSYPSSDPVRAAVAISRARFVAGIDMPMDESSGFGVAWAQHVTLVSATDPSAAAPAAAIAAGGPILFVRDGRLDPLVRDEIVRLMHRPRGFRLDATVDIVGGRSAVPDSVASEIEALGLRVRRFAPATPASTAAAVLRGVYDAYVVVSDTDLPAIASAAGGTNRVLLTAGSTMPTATAAKLNRMAREADTATVYAVGTQAQAAVRSSWPGKQPFAIVDVGGPDIFADSLAAVQSLYDAPGRISVTTTADWRQVLIASMVGPALVVDGRQGPDPAVRDWLAAGQPVLRAAYVFGGSPSLARTVGGAVYGDRYVVRGAPADITG